MKYRIEEKYLCDEKDLVVLRSRLKILLKSDANSDNQGEYTVKSLYFDDYFNSIYFENEDGVSERDKYRIRVYNNNYDNINLEVKSKKYNYVNKTSSILTLEQAKLLIDGKRFSEFMDTNISKAYTKTILKTKLHLLKPVVIVEYTREPYIFKIGNVRITLDKNISASNQVKKFFDESMPKVPLLDTGKFILEVKYDEFLPRHIYNALGLKRLNQIAFSKYYLSRTMLKNTFYN